MLVIPALGRWRQEDMEFQATLGLRPFLSPTPTPKIAHFICVKARKHYSLVM
jgi:hypothetical protein